MTPYTHSVCTCAKAAVVAVNEGASISIAINHLELFRGSSVCVCVRESWMSGEQPTPPTLPPPLLCTWKLTVSELLTGEPCTVSNVACINQSTVLNGLQTASIASHASAVPSPQALLTLLASNNALRLSAYSGDSSSAMGTCTTSGSAT